MMKKIFFSAIIVACIFRTQAWASSAAGIVEKGNRLYQAQKYEDASKQYAQALSKQPDSAVINFDAGAAEYKTKEYQQANRSFEKSMITEDRGLEAKANYNLGNSKYMLGLSKENTDLAGAVQLLEGALNNYKRTQELIPQDQDTKVNYKIVEEKLKELKEKLKQQPQENKNNQEQPQENQKQGQNQQEESGQKEGTSQSGQAKPQDQSNQQQSASAQPPAKSQEPGGASAQQEQEKSEAKPGEDQQPQPSTGQAGQEKQGQSSTAQLQEPKEMSKEEANMLLEGYRQEENTAGMLRDDQKGAEEKVLKDW
jgi:Ca-activated chloride channel homolog